MTEDWALMQYLAGMTDGDASVHASGADLKYALTQVENTKCVVELFQSTLGGTVSDRVRDPKWARVFEFTVAGKSAAIACSRVGPHCHLKREQLELAAQWGDAKTRRVEVCFPDGHTIDFPNALDCERHFVVHHDGVAAYLRGSEKLPVKLRHLRIAYTGEEPASVLQRRAVIIKRLKELKRTVDPPITESLSLPYVAGFLDAEGHFRVTGRSGVAVSVKQKYRAICDALARMFGGSVLIDGEYFKWVKCRGAGELLQQLEPYLRGKRRQAQIILGRTGDDLAEVKQMLSQMTGRQKGGSKRKKRDSENAVTPE